MKPLLPIEILLVEDNLGDARLTAEALRDCKLVNNLHHARDGAEALAFVRREGVFKSRTRPDLILLDLNLPKTTGHEVLADLKNDEDFKTIPIVILTSSEAEIDIVKSYEMYANCYITKPVDLDKFLHVVKQIEAFWFSIVKLPKDALA